MKQNRWQHIIFNVCIVLNCLLVFLLIFYSEVQIPAFLQIVGRAHPLTLHFPIVLLLLAFLFEMLLTSTKKSVPREIADWLLLAASFTTVVAALMGLFLSKEGGYEGDEINAHKWLGVFCALISVIWYGLKKQIRKNKIFTTVIGLCSSVVLLIAGHKGANITHGEDFLFASADNPTDVPPVSMDEAIVYTHLVQPIIENKCTNCHNSNKAKGELVMTSEQLLIKGGKNGKLWDTTAADLGLLMQRIHLPADHKEHMPPKGKPQLTDEESRILYLWIKSGASFTQKVADLPPGDSLRAIAASFFKTDQEETYDFEPLDESVVTALNTEYRVIAPVAQGSPALAVNFYGIHQFQSEQLKDLNKIKSHIVSLHLMKMPVKDEDLKIIGSFDNLRDLNISFTEVKGSGLKYLTGLQHLKQLSLSGTGISAKDLQQLAPLKNISSIKVWNTSVTEKDVNALKATLKDTRFDLGFNGDTVVAKLSTPTITATKGKKVFSGSTVVTIKNLIQNATVRYTVDGSEPDSLHAAVYKAPFTLKQPATIKARAFLKGWISSDPASANFFKAGIKPDSIRLLTKPNPRYVGNAKKGLALTDEALGGLVFNTTEWIGYKNEPFEALLFFDKPVPVRVVTLSALVSTESYIMPPSSIEIWGGSYAGALQLLAKLKPEQPKVNQPSYLTSYECAFPQQPLQVLKIVATQVMSLPAWHAGKGEKAWIFFDEVFIN
ncbi:DUF2231 domain-containing protein [Niabella insulamsoli]|uniref:DUF2231 domain-containing protein n=1 Tax=Niabella insulamsoli TaxID=3144874 RepID=UPI0031FBD7DC